MGPHSLASSYGDVPFKTNVLGTSNVLQASLAEGVTRTLLISSDQACLPANAYGASKFMAEQLAVNFNVYGAPRGSISSVVRYGNVLYSRGSVLTVWEKQAAAWEPLTLTEPGMTRFLITMHQAIHLIGTALNQMEGGEIFIPQAPGLHDGRPRSRATPRISTRASVLGARNDMNS